MSKSNNNNNNCNGIFINQISETQPELQQPSIKRQRIDASSDSAPSKTLPAFLDDSGNSTSSTPSSPSPVNENEIVSLKSCEELSDKECLILFQNHLTQSQCLCGLSERTIKIPFRLYTVTKPSLKSKSSQEEVHQYIKPLKNWPDEFLLKYLSNLQLLFHVYLKQNAKGNICGKVMELCDFLIRNEVKIFEDLIELCNSLDNSNSFISYESSKIITYFLIIIKDEIDQEWLKKIVDNLFTFEHLDYVAVKRINFSLDIIKCIVEWKDHDEHRSEEDESANFHVPSLETNYFATFHDQNSPSTSNALPLYLTSQVSNNSGRSSSTSGHHSPVSNGCHLVQMTDSESFDTTHIKCITTKILANKWPALVKNISLLITQLSNLNSRRTSSENSYNAENCILTFISLWERIISVKTNLSVIETLPFTAHLANFELRLNQNLPCTIYKQMLQLFNEALCYGSTLALQDLLPEETCNLAHQIIRHVKDNRILESMPRQVTANETEDNLKTFIGLNCETVAFLPHSFDQTIIPENSVNSHSSMTFDKSLLQKMTLVVLKSVAVSVKEIRIDSSDSSIDSTDYEAFQEMTLIENSIRDVLKKLESFIKNTLEFHPESHFSKILIHLFDDQDDFLIEAMVCTLDVTSGISYRNNAFPELVSMLNPVYTFLEFLKMISNSADLLLDLLVSSETCFLLYLLRFLKYIRFNWSMFVQSCRDCGMGHNVLDDTMDVLTRLRHKIGRLVSKSLYPYDIAPILRLLESCENLYEGNELS
jgi:protein Lines